jgi:hypothetical protein
VPYQIKAPQEANFGLSFAYDYPWSEKRFGART